MIEAIRSELFDTFTFAFEGNYDKLIKKFCHMSLFPVCLHLLRCQRSCEKRCSYCKMCSRVRENTFYEYDAFLSLNVGSDGYVNISSSERIVLDVFLSKPPYFPYCFTESTGKCSDFEVFSFARDLFACFCSVRVRMYLSITTEYFSDLISLLSLSDEKKIVRKIFPFAHLLLHTFFDLNYLFFYEFFYLLVSLMRVTVLLYVQISQNMVRIVGQKVPWKS